MDRRKIKATAEHLRRFMRNLVLAKTTKPEYLPPQVAVYHVTYDCNAHCAWCSRRQDREGPSPKVSWSRVEQIFCSLRQVAPALYLTGGEPLLSPRIEDMLRLARELGFYPIAVNTNGTLLEERSLVPELADVTVVSLHSVDPDKLAGVYAMPGLLAVKTLRNALRSAQVAKDFGNELMVNCVLSPENAQEAEGVRNFCLEHKIPLFVTPAIVNHEPLIKWAETRQRSAYNSFLDRVIRDRNYGPTFSASSPAYLWHIRMFETFDCRPTSILSVSPEGYILNPCEIKYPGLPKRLAWIDGADSLLELMPKLLGGERKFSPCPKNCLKACYAEPALAFENPLQAAFEYLL